MLSAFRQLHVVLDDLSDEDFLKTPTASQIAQLFEGTITIDFEGCRSYHVAFLKCLRDNPFYMNEIIAFMSTAGRKR